MSLRASCICPLIVASGVLSSWTAAVKKSILAHSAADGPLGSGKTTIASELAGGGAWTAPLSVARNSSTTKGFETTPTKPASRLRAEMPARSSASASASAVNMRTGSVGWARRIAAASCQDRERPVRPTSPSRITHLGSNRSIAPAI